MFIMWLITVLLAVYLGRHVRRRLDELRSTVARQGERIARLEAASGPSAYVPPAGNAAVAPMPVPDALATPTTPPSPQTGTAAAAGEFAPASPVPAPKRGDLELDFGRNWLSKIGIGVLALGMAFLISYTFKYFGPFVKIAFGYAVAGAMFWAGARLERDARLMNFGRALLGGGWAITYFTTYAMHHFDASRVIASQGLDLFLLGAVVVGMMAHVLRHRSEEMMGVTLCVAYVTSTIGHITLYTVLSNLLLSVVILFLVYKFQWVRILSFGVAMTYAIHMVWVAPHVSNINFMLLSAYWVVFLVGVHLIRSPQQGFAQRLLAGTNFSNIALYTALSYRLLNELLYEQRFLILLAEGLLYLGLSWVMRRRQNRGMFVSDMCAGILVLTFALLVKLELSSVWLWWLMEVPLLLLMGVTLKERTFRYLAYALTAGVSLLIVQLTLWGGMGEVHVFGCSWSWTGYASFWGMLAMAAAFYLSQQFKGEKDFLPIDRTFDQVFSALAWGYGSWWLLSLASFLWVSFVLTLWGWGLLLLGAVPGWRRFRAYAYMVLLFAAFGFLGNPVDTPHLILRWFLAVANTAMFVGVYHAVRHYKAAGAGPLFWKYEEEAAFWCGLGVLVVALHQYIFAPWISLSLGVASAALILTGIAFGNKIERLGGMGLLALTLGRVGLIDLSGLDILFKIITLIALGVVFLGVSYVYNRYSGRGE